MSKRTMISPGDACALIGNGDADPRQVKSFLLNYAAGKSIYVDAERTFQPGKAEAPNKRIPADILRRERGAMPASFWKSASWTRGQTEYYGIRFDRDDVVQAAKFFGQFSSDPNHAAVPNAGRSSGKHGQPITRIALRYVAAPDEQFNRLTGVALAEELRNEYRDLGYAMPSSPNAESICAGILRELRKHRKAG